MRAAQNEHKDIVQMVLDFGAEGGPQGHHRMDGLGER